MPTPAPTLRGCARSRPFSPRDCPTELPPRLAVPLETLRRERDALGRHVAALEERIDALEVQPPFTLQDPLSDDVWVEERRMEIEARTATFAAQEAALNSTLQTLTEALFPSLSHGSKPGLN